MRKDFKVWVPLLDKPNRDYVITDKGDKQWYYNKLKTCYVGFSPNQKYGGWSVATTDGMMNGVPYVMYNALPNAINLSNPDFNKIVESIDKKRFFKFNNNHYDFIMKENTIVSVKDPHPSVEGHTKWANELKEFIDVNNLRTIQ